jgi:hypothetical protein
MRRIFPAFGLVLALASAPGARNIRAEERLPVHVEQGSVAIVDSNAAGATINVGLTPEQVQELTKAAAAGAVGPLADKVLDLSNRLGVTQGAVLTMLRILGERDVPIEQLPQKLAEVATQFQKLQAQLAALDPRNPSARGLVEQAQAEVEHERVSQRRAGMHDAECRFEPTSKKLMLLHMPDEA